MPGREASPPVGTRKKTCLRRETGGMTAAEGRALGAPRTPGSAGVPAPAQGGQTSANTGAGAELETATRLHQTTEQRSRPAHTISSRSVSSSSSSSSIRRTPPSLGLGVWARHTEAPARCWLGEREIEGPSGPPDLEPALGTAPSSRDHPEEQGHGVARRDPVPPPLPPPAGLRGRKKLSIWV